MALTTIPVSAQMHDHVMTLTGLPARVFFWEATPVVAAFAEVAEYYNMDVFGATTDAYNYEIEAMGGKLIYGENTMPTIDYRDPLIKEPADLLKLRPPDFRRDGRLPYALECMKLSGEHPMGRGVGFMCGTFSMAVGMRGYPKLVRDMCRDPAFVRDLMTFIVDEIQLPYMQVQKDYAGVSAVISSDAWAMVPNLSVAQLNEWVVSFGQRLREKAVGFGVTPSPGGGDYCEERPEKFDAGLLHDCLRAQMALSGKPMISLGMGPWHEHPLAAVTDFLTPYRESGTEMTVRVTINARLLRDGPVSRIVETVRRYVDTFGHDYGLLITLANIPADTPTDHVHAAVAAIHAYGQKPIPADLSTVKFTLPHRESFTEWRERRQAGH
jgi:uroporphyrinogen-III decarboxylase